MISTSPELFTALASIHVLAGTSLPAQNLIAEEGILHDFPAGAWIVREGDEGHAFFILVEGDVDVIKGADCPHTCTLATLHRGDFFGEMSIIEPMHRAASIRAVGPVRAIEVKSATLHHLYKKMPDQYAIVLLNLARDMARRLRLLDEAFCARA